MEITALLRYAIHMHETSNPQVDKVTGMAREIVVKPFGIFSSSKKRKRGIAQRLKRCVHALQVAVHRGEQDDADASMGR